MEMREARLLLGFPPNSSPTQSQVKAAFRERVWDFHPDRVPDHAKAHAESKFKLASDVAPFARFDLKLAHFHHVASFGNTNMLWSLQYQKLTTLLSGGEGGSSSASYSRVVRTGVPVATGGRNWALMGVPFFFVIFGAVGLGGLSATRAYRRQKETFPSSHNPFLP